MVGVWIHAALQHVPESKCVWSRGRQTQRAMLAVGRGLPDWNNERWYGGENKTKSQHVSSVLNASVINVRGPASGCCSLDERADWAW